MKIPSELRQRLKSELWKRADELDWAHLSPSSKADHYDRWARSSDIGDILAQYMPRSDIRVYLKDSLLRGYSKAKLQDPERPLRVLNVDSSIDVEETYSKPLGCRLSDGRMIVWGRAQSWKTILLGLHQRVFMRQSASAFGVVLFDATGRFKQQVTRAMVEDASSKLGVNHIKWIEK